MSDIHEAMTTVVLEKFGHGGAATIYSRVFWSVLGKLCTI